MANKKKKPQKNVFTVLPSGLATRINKERKMATLDFLDLDYDNNPNVVGSYALDEKMLKDLSSTIKKLLGDLSK
jgi:hypothetical protein